MRFLIMTLALLAGCSSTVPAVDQTRCIEMKEIPEATATLLASEARKVLGRIAAGEADQLHGEFHPAIQGNVDLTAFRAQLEGLTSIVHDVEKTTVQEMYLVNAAGESDESDDSVLCGSADRQATNHRLLRLGATGDRVAVVQLRTHRQRVNHGLTIQLRESNGAWRLWGLHAGVAETDGHDSSYYEERARTSESAGDLVSAHVFYTMAQQLQTQAPYMQSGNANRVAERMRVVRENPAFAAAASLWTIDGRAFDIVNLGIVITKSEFGVVVHYVTDSPMTDEGVGPEAVAFAKHIQNNFGALADEFDSVLVSAYGERPTDPARQYPTFRLGTPLREK